MKVQIDPEQCIGCGVCAVQCPEHAIAMAGEPEPVAVVNHEYCTACGVCMQLCPVQAATFVGEGGRPLEQPRRAPSYPRPW